MAPGKKEFIVVLALLLLTRLLDGVTTYIASPDLRFEANPLVRYLHLGWLGLGLAVSALTALVVYLAYLYYLRPLSYGQLPASATSSLTRFATYVSYGPKGKWTEFLFRLPRAAVLARMVGYAAAMTMIVLGVYLVVNNTLFIFDTHPVAVRWVQLGGESERTRIVVTVLAFCVACLSFYRREYHRALAVAAGPGQGLPLA